jgi:hypothetical protein
MAEPISIRTKNPGAMWGGARANKWGATADLLTGDSEGNHIAVFPTKVQGAAAQFDLWRNVYTGMSLGAAITKWSGGNSSPQYVTFLTEQTGILIAEVITTKLLSGPKGLALMKAQAHWEAGKPYPMTDAEWQAAQSLVFHGAVIPPPPDIPAPEPQPEPRPSTGFWSLVASVVRMIFNSFRRK